MKTNRVDSQQALILAHLRRGGRITPLRALSLFHCMALSQRIGEIEREPGWLNPGEAIERGWQKLSSGKKVREYWLTTKAQRDADTVRALGAEAQVTA